MNRKILISKFTAASAALLTLLAASSLRAGTITVVGLPATGTDAASGISSANTYLDAWDFGNKPNDPTISGVPFTHLDPGKKVTSTVTATDGDFIGTLTLSCGGPGSILLNRNNLASLGNLAGQAGAADGRLAPAQADVQPR